MSPTSTQFLFILLLPQEGDANPAAREEELESRSLDQETQEKSGEGSRVRLQQHKEEDGLP